jgi:hypothetical protein
METGLPQHRVIEQAFHKNNVRASANLLPGV